MPSRIAMRTCAGIKYAEAKDLLVLLEEQIRVKDVLRTLLEDNDFAGQQSAIAYALEKRQSVASQGELPRCRWPRSWQIEKVSAAIEAKSSLDAAIAERNVDVLRECMAKAEENKEMLDKLGARTSKVPLASARSLVSFLNP